MTSKSWVSLLAFCLLTFAYQCHGAGASGADGEVEPKADEVSEPKHEGLAPENPKSLKRQPTKLIEPKQKRVQVGVAEPQKPREAYFEYTKNEDGQQNTWSYNSNAKMMVLIGEFATRMKYMVEELLKNEHKFDEWDSIKKIFKDSRRDDPAVEQFGDELKGSQKSWDKESSKIRTKVVRQLARRSGYFIKEDNLHMKIDRNSPLYHKLFDHEKDAKSQKAKIFQTKEYRQIADAWKKLNTNQVWVMLWNLFSAVGNSKLNHQLYSPRIYHAIFHLRERVDKDLDFVAQALKEHFAKVKGSSFADKDPWSMDTEGVEFGTEQSYQKEWGLLSFPARVVQSLSGEMKDEEHLMSSLGDLIWKDAELEIGH